LLKGQYGVDLERISLDRILNGGARKGKSIFIGHGRSQQWSKLRDYIHDQLQLPWVEFNKEPVAGILTLERLLEMLEVSAFAFLIMTGDDDFGEGALRARQNVIHELGLCQGRLGARKAVALLEEGCDEFSNIQGLNQIRFPRNNISAAFDEVRRVLEREGLLESGRKGIGGGARYG
jgi:predicted nucleotide-binding protein